MHDLIRVLHSKVETMTSCLPYATNLPSKFSPVSGLVIFMMCDHLAEEALITEDENGDYGREGGHTQSLLLRYDNHCV
jgi:hypothetical protein